MKLTKMWRSVVSFMLVVCMVMGTCGTAFAAEKVDASKLTDITVSNEAVEAALEEAYNYIEEYGPVILEKGYQYAVEQGYIAQIEQAIADAKIAAEEAAVYLDEELIPALEAKIAELEAQLEALKPELEKAIEDAKVEIEAEINAKIAEVEEAIAALEAKIAEIKAEIEAATEAVAAIEDAMNNFVAILKGEAEGDLNVAVDEIQAALDKLAEEVEITADAIAAINSAIDEIQDLVADVIEALEALKAEVEAAIEELKAKAEELKQKVEDLKAEVEEAIEDAKAKLEAAIAEIEAIIAQVEAAIEEVKATIAEIEAAIEELKAEVEAKIETAIADAKAAYAELEAKVEALIAEIEAAYIDATTGEYVLADSNYYVALGDSTAYELDNADNYAAVLAAGLGLTDAQVAQNAITGARVDDILAILDASYDADAYAEALLEGVNTDAYVEAIDKADLITISIANLDYIANVIGDDTADWARFIGEEGAAKIDEAMVELAAYLAENGLGEMADYVVSTVESYLYSCVGYAFNYGKVLNAIHDINEDAQVIVVGMYNPFADLVVEGIAIGEYIGKVIELSNLCLTGYAMAVANTVYVDAPAVETGMPADADLETYALAFLGGAYAPTEAGHAYIAGQILNALTVTKAETPVVPEEPTPEDPKPVDPVDPVDPTPDVPGSSDQVVYEGPYTVATAKASYEFTGKRLTPAVVVTDKNGKEVPAENYTVAYAKNKWVGKATVTVTLKSGETATTTFKITKARAKSLKVKDIVYTGKNVTKKNIKIFTSAGVPVKAKWIKSIKVQKNKKNVGTVKVTVKFKGKQIKNVKYTYKAKIVPQSTKISKIKAAKKSLTITWKKKTAQVSGYQIQVSTSKKFTNKSIVASVKAKKASTTKKTIKKLDSNKKYYVRIRTYKKVGKKTYRSAWSTVKSKKTK